jgi:two-component system OmpR family sensor kinase/two-component system sensor histidine kinase BaeS
MRLRRQPRLFNLMLTAFALVIVLGVGGMFGFFWLAANSFNNRPGMNEMMGGPTLAARQLASYYERNRSWDGIERQFERIVARGPRRTSALVLVDPTGTIIASNRDDMRVGQLFDPRLLTVQPQQLPIMPTPVASNLPASSLPPLVGITTQSVPIALNGQVVGLLFYSLPTAQLVDDGHGLQIVRGIIAGGLGLVGVLLGLAALFARQISRPLRQVTGAAQALAAGSMDVRVQPPNVRELGELAGAFNSMADALAQADQQRRQLTADVAHELRTPLAIVKGRLEGIQDGVYQADPAQIDGLLHEVALLERLIDDLRLLALAEAGQLPLYPEPVDLAELLHATQRAFAHAASERGVTLELVLPADLPEILADPQRISQVLGNLVSNALRHTPAGGQVTLRAEADAGQINVRVEDSGQGIAAEHLPHVFDRFYRADRSRTRSSGGAGLGLAIVRQIVVAHGGTITATSALGAGTTIRFTLPQAAP